MRMPRRTAKRPSSSEGSSVQFQRGALMHTGRLDCREPSWLENIELGAKKAIKRENIDQKILTFDGFASPLRSSQAVSHTHSNALGRLGIVSSQRR
jgi:hypothetical protein